METICRMVSVIIPVYNRQDFLEECVRSVLEQSHQEFEVLLIDDGSTDNSLDISRSMMASDSRIKLMTTEHVGVSTARNIGLDAACGEYVFFLDSDDIIHPRLFEALVSDMQQSGAVMAGTNCRSCLDEHWEAVRDKFLGDDSSIETVYRDHQDTLKAVFGHYSPFGMIGGVMMRRDLIGDTRFSEELFIGEDFYFIYQNLIKDADTVSLKQAWYLARSHGQNTSWQYDFDAFWTRFNRRVLVWRSEESFGRVDYANVQRHDAYNVFERCAVNNKIYCKDMKRIRKTLREYKREMLSGLIPRIKAEYLISAYLPIASFCMLKIKGAIGRRRRRRKIS